MKPIKTKTIIVILIVVFGCGLLLYLASNVIPKALISSSKASGSSKVSISNSYVLGQKISADSDGKDKAIVNVFVLDNDGLGVQGKTVSLNGMNNISPTSVVSDKEGKASFEMSSTVEGQFTITAEVGGMELPKNVKVTFRK